MRKGRSAWIVEWVAHRGDIKRILDSRPHILPYRWNSTRVMDYMRVLYWNSPLHKPFGTLQNVNLAKPPGIFNEGMRYGDATHLKASLVKDLMVYQVGQKTVLEWTDPARYAIDRNQGKSVQQCDPKARRVEL